jgi:integrase
MALTDKEARTARPKAKPYKRYDRDGLFLLITPSAGRAGKGRYWRLKYRLHGKENTLALGTYPEVSLAQARAAAQEARTLLRQGTDPVHQRRREKQQAALSHAHTFKAVAMEWLDSQRGRWSPKHYERVLRGLGADLFPAIGALPVAEITPQDVLAVARNVEKRGALYAASRVIERAGSVFRFAVQTLRSTTNPAAELRGALKGRKVKHRAAVKESELPGLLRAVASYPGDPVTKLGLQMLALTFVRPGELRGARWDELDIAAGLWRIPAERMKMRAEHLVPLSRQTLAVVEALRPFTGRGEFLFPSRSSRDPQKTISENTFIYALYRLGYQGKATAHGFRATACTILNEQGWRPDVIERQLAHLERNKVRAAYHRSEYLEDRRKMMQHWADYLDAIVQGAAVVSLHRGRA